MRSRCGPFTSGTSCRNNRLRQRCYCPPNLITCRDSAKTGHRQPVATYKGTEEFRKGEAFDATPAAIEARTIAPNCVPAFTSPSCPNAQPEELCRR